MKTLHALLAAGLLAAPVLSGCDSAGPDHDEGEVITRVTYTLTPTSGGTAQTATFVDANRNGVVDAGEATGVALAAGTTYAGTVAVYGPAGEITPEIADEDDQHAFVFTFGGADASRLTVTSADHDANGLPFRRLSTLAVGGTTGGTATMRLELVHFGSEDAKKAALGVPTAAMERDVDVTFPVALTAAR